MTDGREPDINLDDALNVLRRLLTLGCGRQRLAEVVEINPVGELCWAASSSDGSGQDLR